MWSFGWISSFKLSVAIFAIISLAFIFVEVPDPVWNMSTTKSVSWSPLTTCWAALIIESATFLSNNLFFKLTSAQADQKKTLHLIQTKIEKVIQLKL